MATSEWFEDEEIWRIFVDCMFTEERFRAAEQEVDQLLSLVGFVPERVLDLGCGPGRHAVPLAARGARVTGVDISAFHLEMASKRASRAGVSVQWLRQDMREVLEPERFDLVVNLWSSFGYFDDPQDDRQVLGNCFQSLTPGGVMVLDVTGKEYVCRHIQPVHLTELDDGKLLIERPVVDRQMTRYSNQWILIDQGRAHTAEWHHNLYSGQELLDRMSDAGFQELALYGDLGGSDFDLDAERLVVVGRKP
ncbi:MAG: class I SAM-dependent methyltransferase [Xanthomonadales bacterium]|nr:class I SAM-dependent methyltransferase [Xanthomonadales bacterium]